MFDRLKHLDRDLQDALFVQLRNLWTHASTAIEGNTLTLGETAFVLGEGLTVSCKPLKDHQEVLGHARAIELVYEIVKRDKPLCEANLFALHAAVQVEQVFDVYKPVGGWKFEPNSTVMVFDDEQIIFEYAAPEDVPGLMEKWFALFERFQRASDTARERSRDEALQAYVHIHTAFVRIHPFSDGNGRLARLVANIPVIRAGFPPIIIPKQGRQEYSAALTEYHQQAGPLDAEGELLPNLEALDRFSTFCSSAWAESNRLVDKAFALQRNRESKVQS
ncbi:Fic family protein [Desulfonatronum thioautotrophicum]|uniref:Fic family protein n=1 Tax=Desulfonatronum thioautotrophicum TaxID=617001 RepID=UPI0005EBCF6B|nr:Fic family protein [Desulfonatronum thioautotrophicum]